MKKYFKESVFILSLCTAVLAFESAGIAMDCDADDKGKTTVVSKSPKFPELTEDEIEAKKWLSIVVKTISLIFWGK